MFGAVGLVQVHLAQSDHIHRIAGIAEFSSDTKAFDENILLESITWNIHSLEYWMKSS